MKECVKCRTCYDDDVMVCPKDQAVPAATLAGSTTISGRYILEKRLGQGGMGIVFRAKHKFLKSLHAIKVILPSLVDGDADLLVRFNQEAVLAASIDHPNVIRVTDFGVENDVMPFLVMEYIDGIALSSYLVEDKPLPLKDALELFLPVAEGVAEAHGKGIVHRDLKPQNIMVQRNMPVKKAVKVLDFGLAKIKSADSYPSLIQAKTMNIVGSPPYMSPEQWSGEGVDHRTDIYALAVILYQMLTGRLPFQADSMPAMMYQHLTVPPPEAASFGVSVDPGVEAVLKKALEKDRANRYDSMDILLGDLVSTFQTGTSSSLTGAATEILSRDSLRNSAAQTAATGQPLSESQKERFYAYFDSQSKPVTIGDEKLAKEFLDAQDKIQDAKTEAVNADMLVKELAEAQRLAEEAQDKALKAKQQIEADVRRQVEAEMKRLEVESQTQHEAKAKQLSDEVEARRVAEERANFLAQAALQAQQLAEDERKRREEEAQKREMNERDRQQAEIEAKKLAEQVAEAKKQYENARAEAVREAQQRADLEAKQRKIESDLQALAANETEQRRILEEQAKKYINEQAEKFEREAADAQKRLTEASALIDLEAKKREQAEAARLQAEEEASRLSKEIVEVHRQMQEMQMHMTDSQNRSVNSLSNASVNTMGGGQPSMMTSSVTTNPGGGGGKKTLIGLAAGAVLLLIFAVGGIGLFLFVRRPTVANGTNGTNAVTPPPPGKTSALKQIAIKGGTFQMGRNEVPSKTDPPWSYQYPAHSVPVGDFSIDISEVTNAEYALFVNETQRTPPWPGGKVPAGQENFPVDNVSYLDAENYATWIAARESRRCHLPTEEQWEFAARNGDKQTIYPWGNDPAPERAVLSGKAVAVGTSQDKTLGGVYDMLGNVSEWTSSVFKYYDNSPAQLARPKTHVIRGLNFRAPAESLAKPDLMITFRQVPDTDATKGQALGFRLVCEP